MASGGDASRQTPGCRSRSNHSCWLIATLCFSDSRRFGFRLPPAHLCSVCCLPLNHRANETFLSDDSFPGDPQAAQPLQPLPSSGSSPGLTTPTQLNGKKSEMSLPPMPAHGKSREFSGVFRKMPAPRPDRTPAGARRHLLVFEHSDAASRTSTRCSAMRKSPRRKVGSRQPAMASSPHPARGRRLSDN